MKQKLIDKSYIQGTNDDRYNIEFYHGDDNNRDWSVFQPAYSGTGLFENYTGKISTTGADQPTVLDNTTFKNIFKGVNLSNDDYGNFDSWDKSGVTQVTLQGNLMANGFQVAASMKIVNSTEETVVEFDSGQGGNYEIDVNPNLLTETFTIEINDSVDVARAIRNEGVIQKIQISKSEVYKGLVLSLIHI